MLFSYVFIINKPATNDGSNNLVKQEVSFEPYASNELLVKAEELDSDGDGLKDWEEVLWKTDPNNPDSNGDGVNDFVEVSLKKAEADKLALEKITAVGGDPASKTSLLAIDFFSNYFSLGNPEKGVPSDTLDFLTSGSVQKITSKSATKTYSLLNLNITDSLFENFRDYGNAVGGLIKKYPERGDPLELLQLSAVSGDTASSNNIMKTSKDYGNFVTEMLLVETPEEMAFLHLALINISEALRSDTEKMSGVLDDPVGALLSAQTYVSDLDKANSVIEKISIFLRNKGVNYSPTENGNVLY